MISPLHHLHEGAQVDCAYCGASHGFDGSTWDRLLPQAHEVIDLAGSAPHVASDEALRSSRNPHLPVGTSMVGRELEEPHAIGGRAPLRMRVAPGHPMRAGAPLAWAREPTGVAVPNDARGRSADTLRFTVAPALRARFPALVAVLSAARADGVAEAAMIDRGGQAIQLACPSCGAPGEADAAAQLRCGYCGVLSLVSNRSWHRLGRKPPEPAPTWALFQGASQRRTTLATRGAQSDFQAELRARALAAMRAK